MSSDTPLPQDALVPLTLRHGWENKWKSTGVKIWYSWEELKISYFHQILLFIIPYYNAAHSEKEKLKVPPWKAYPRKERSAQNSSWLLPLHKLAFTRCCVYPVWWCSSCLLLFVLLSQWRNTLLCLNLTWIRTQAGCLNRAFPVAFSLDASSTWIYDIFFYHQPTNPYVSLSIYHLCMYVYMYV